VARGAALRVGAEAGESEITRWAGLWGSYARFSVFIMTLEVLHCSIFPQEAL